MMNNGMAVFASAVAPKPGFWLKRAAQGFVAGASLTALDFLYYLPFLSSTSDIGFGSFVSSLIIWSGECVLFALVLAFAEVRANRGEWRTWQIAIAILVGLVVGVTVWHAFSILVLRNQLGLRLFRDRIGQPGSPIGTALYHAWLMVFFGGLIIAVAISQRWRMRMLSALRSAELARATSQQRLAEARLASLEARIDPDYLYRALSRLERLYEDDPAGADRLLDELIAFLRHALAEARVPILQEAP